MLEQDRGNFYALMTGLFEMYSKKASPELLDIYFGALRGYELGDLSRAANLHALDPDAGSFMPKPADFVRHIEGSKSIRAMRAWSAVERAVRMVGQYESVTFDDPIIHAVIEDMGGWVDLCQTATEKDLEFKAREFDKRYQGYALQGGAPEYPSRLVGLIEADYSQRGLPAPKPKLIGNVDRARAVLTGGRTGTKQLTQSVSEVIGGRVIPMLTRKQDGAA